jgi:uncharacterized membrane protein YdjX (TVP38/TMEM64 family)
LPVVGVPITPFFVVAGATFGARYGLIGSCIAIGVNLAICYWTARLMRPTLESLFRRFNYPLPPVRPTGRRAVRFTLALKLAPAVPQFVKNWGLGLARVPFAICFPISILVTGAYAASLIFLGESLLRHDLPRVLIAGGVVVALGVGLWLLGKRRKARAEG